MEVLTCGPVAVEVGVGEREGGEGRELPTFFLFCVFGRLEKKKKKILPSSKDSPSFDFPRHVCYTSMEHQTEGNATQAGAAGRSEKA